MRTLPDGPLLPVERFKMGLLGLCGQQQPRAKATLCCEHWLLQLRGRSGLVRDKDGGRGGFPTGGFLALTLPTVPSGLDARDAADAHAETPQTPR